MLSPTLDAARQSLMDAPPVLSSALARPGPRWELMKWRTGPARPFTPFGSALPTAAPLFRTVVGANCRWERAAKQDLRSTLDAPISCPSMPSRTRPEPGTGGHPPEGVSRRRTAGHPQAPVPLPCSARAAIAIGSAVSEAGCAGGSPLRFAAPQGPGKVVQWAKRRGARTVVTHKRWWWAPALT